MRYRKLSPTGDYVFGNGQKDFWRDQPEAVGQACQTRLRLWIGEWYLNIDSGTPYLQGILGKHSQEVANVAVQQRVIGTQGLVRWTNFESEIEPNSRDYSVTFGIDTIYGPTEVQIKNYINY